MEFIITIDEAEAFDSFAALVGKPGESIMVEAFRDMLGQWVSEHRGVITAWSVSAVQSEDDDDSEPVRSGVSDRDAMRAVKATQGPAGTVRATKSTQTRPAPQSAPQGRSQGTDDDSAPRAAGRPKFRRDDNGVKWVASDGGSVTETGKRSVQELREIGVACVAPFARQWPKWYVNTLSEGDGALEWNEDGTIYEGDEEIETPAPKRSVRVSNSAPAADAPVMRTRTRK